MTTKRRLREPRAIAWVLRLLLCGALVALVAPVACESPRPALVPDAAPTVEPEAKPAETKPTPTETKPTETKPTETKPTETKPTETKPTETKPGEIAAEPVVTRKPASESRPPAVAKRSAGASDGLKECKMPEPPGACSSDADCSSFDVGLGPCGGCASTLTVGVSAAQKDAYLAKSKCQRPACNRPSPSCVVHWHVADDGSRGGPNEIVVRCVESAAGRGTCLTLREHP